MKLGILGALAPVLALAVACGGGSQPTATPTMGSAANPTPTPASLHIVTTTTLLADWVSQVAGDRAEVSSLLGPGTDPHSFQPGAQDVARVADADLVLTIGLGLEGAWLNRLIQNAAADPARIVAVGEAVDAIEAGAEEDHADEDEDAHLLEEIDGIVHEYEEGYMTAEAALEAIEELLAAEGSHDHAHEGEGHDPVEDIEEILHEYEDGHLTGEAALEAVEELLLAEGAGEHGHEDDDGHDHGPQDPHFWFDPLRVKRAVSDIAARLSVLDMDGSGEYQANAAAYQQELDALDAWTKEQVAAIPADRRLLVTTHDSLRYLAVRYGFQVIGTVIPGVANEREPSAEEMRALVEHIRAAGAPAVFTESTLTDRLTRTIAEEAQVRVINGLYTDSVGISGSGLESYTEVMQYNIRAIVEALT